MMLRLESSWHGRSVDHVLTYSVRQIAVGFRNLHELRGKGLVAQVSQTRRFANRSGFDAPIVVVLAWEERGSCLNIFWTTNHGRISETLTNYEAKEFLRNESITSVRVVFANRSGFDAPIGVVLAWEERGSCLNILRTTNHGGISETFTNYESSWHGGSCLNIFRMTNHGRIFETYTNYEAKDSMRMSVYHVLTYSGPRITVGSQNLHELRGKRLVAQVSQTRRFANRCGFDAPIGVVLAWEVRGSCLSIFRMTKRGRISEAFTNYEAKDLLRKSVDHVLTYSGRQIAVVFQKPSQLRGKRLVAQVSQTRRFANRCGFDAPIGVVLAWEVRGSCLNIFRTTNRGRISETFMDYEAKDLLRNESNTSVGVVFPNRKGFDAPIGVVLAWEECGSCLNIFRTTNRGWILETFTNYDAKDMLRNESNTSVRVVFANRSGFDAPIGVVLASEERGSCLNIFRQIAVVSQKPSRITRQKACCANESNTSVGVVFANWSGFDAPIGVVLAWEERG
ncbi:uncharacterized protein G2W53_009968 [Senna tora]|uniref:Uncharacterized protein n=1 Tax=Senna tora TaxID=362788 RepID=A0A835C916_9FABA|nr:uncharacterized protein G2W53_009968 [Senna tora]